MENKKLINTLEQKFDEKFPSFDVHVTVRNEEDVEKGKLIKEYWRNMRINLLDFIYEEKEESFDKGYESGRSDASF